MSARRRIDINNRSDPRQTAILANADLTVYEAARLTIAMREAMNESFKVSYAMFREMRELYLQARAVFLRKFFDARR